MAWATIVFMFSNQTGYESSKVSDKVTRKLLQVKDTLEIVVENYEQNKEIVIKRN